MTSPSWLLVIFFISAVGAGFLSPPSSDLFLPQNPRYFPLYFKFPVSSTSTTTTEVAVTLSPLRISTYSSPPASTPEVRKSPPPPPPHNHPHPPHDHDHPHPPPPPPPPKKKDRRPSAPAAAQDQDGERSFPGEATLVKFEDWPPVQVYGSQPGINSRVSETLDRSSSPGLDSRKDRRPDADGGQRSWSGTATPVNVEDLSPRVQVYGSQPSGRIITSKSSRVSGQKTTLDQSSAPLRVTTKSLTGDRRVSVPAPVVVKSRSYSFAPLDGLGSSSETISRSRFQQGRRPSADPVSTTAKSMRARSVPAPVVVRSRSYSFAPPDGLDSSSATSSRFQQQQRRRSPPPARDVVSNYVQMAA